MSALVIGGLPLADADDMVRRYCGLSWRRGANETWAYRYFELVDDDAPDTVGPVDVLAATALHPGLRQSDLAWFWQHRDECARLLEGLPPDLDLGDATSPVVLAVQSLPARLAGTGVELSLLSKVLHRKRPRLVPMLDRTLLDRYRPYLPGRGAQSWAQLVEVLRGDLANPANVVTLTSLSASLAGELPVVPTHLRIIDIAVWMNMRAKGTR